MNEVKKGSKQNCWKEGEVKKEGGEEEMPVDSLLCRLLSWMNEAQH